MKACVSWSGSPSIVNSTGYLRHDGDAVLEQLPVKQPDDLVKDRADGYLLPALFVRLGQREQLFHQVVYPVELPRHHRREVGDGFVIAFRDSFPDYLRKALDGGDRVLDLVSERRGKRPHGRELISLEELPLRLELVAGKHGVLDRNCKLITDRGKQVDIIVGIAVMRKLPPHHKKPDGPALDGKRKRDLCTSR